MLNDKATVKTATVISEKIELFIVITMLNIEPR